MKILRGSTSTKNRKDSNNGKTVDQKITLFPESGLQRTIKLEAPMLMRSIVSFE